MNFGDQKCDWSLNNLSKAASENNLRRGIAVVLYTSAFDGEATGPSLTRKQNKTRIWVIYAINISGGDNRILIIWNVLSKLILQRNAEM